MEIFYRKIAEGGNIMNKIFKLIFDEDYRFDFLSSRGLLNKMSDHDYLKKMFKIRTGKNLVLDNPQTYNQKLQWIKLYDHNPMYIFMVDKYEAKKYVAKLIGEEYIIPTLGVWNNFDEINFDNLPDQFVLKCTHDSGGVVIIRDKSAINRKEIKRKIEKSLKRNFYYYGREWPYKDVKPRIIAEKYMVDTTAINDNDQCNNVLKDYKIYTFNGKAKMCMINTDRGIDTRADYFDRDFNWLDFFWGYNHADTKPQKPVQYERMFELAETLAQGTTELRVDFYVVNNKIYFGELTFFDGSGFDPIVPEEWDIKIGSWLKLPAKEGE